MVESILGNAAYDRNSQVSRVQRVSSGEIWMCDDGDRNKCVVSFCHNFNWTDFFLALLFYFIFLNSRTDSAKHPRTNIIFAPLSLSVESRFLSHPRLFLHRFCLTHNVLRHISVKPQTPNYWLPENVLPSLVRVLKAADTNNWSLQQFPFSWMEKEAH